MLRIVAGRFGGRRLKGPRHEGLRPTSERVREALFNILGPRLTGATVLDLFAGTGSLGIEALSRGAKQALFVERDRQALALLRANLAALTLTPAEAGVLACPVAEAADRLARQGASFSLILADPPYAAGVLGETMGAVAAGDLLAPGGLMVLEHRATDTPEPGPGLAVTDRRRYGDTGLTFLERANNNVEF